MRYLALLLLPWLALFVSYGITSAALTDSQSASGVISAQTLTPPTPSPTPVPTCLDFTPPYATGGAFPAVNQTANPVTHHFESVDALTGDATNISAVQSDHRQSGAVQSISVLADTFTVDSAGTYTLESSVDIDANLLALDGSGTSGAAIQLIGVVFDQDTGTPVTVDVLRSEFVSAGGGSGDQFLAIHDADQSFTMAANLSSGVNYLWAQYVISHASATSTGGQLGGLAVLETHLDQVSVCPSP